MNKIEYGNGTEEIIFSYDVKKDNKVLIYWYDKLIKILAGNKAEKILAKLQGADDFETQQILAKATGNLKRKKDGDTNTIVIRGSHFTREKKTCEL